MFEFTDRPVVEVQEAEYARLLGYPRGHMPGGRAHELMDWARDWYAGHGQPWIFARAAGGLELGASEVRLGGSELTSPYLKSQLHAADAHDAVLVAVSAGKDCETLARQCWQEGKPDEYFFLEMFGSAVVEQLIANAAGRICAWADLQHMAALPHYSPGYSGWPVTDQGRLLDLVRGRPGNTLPAELEALDSGMLRPKKSLLAFFGLTRHLDRVRQLANLIPCENCSLGNCHYRRAPYGRAVPQIEDVRQLQGAGPQNGPGVRQVSSALTQDARYSINQRALRKWSQERLDVHSLPDGSTKARFRYEGTTCSNLGFPMEFHYQVELAPPAEGYRITAAECAPAPGDAGHTHQCEYLTNSDDLMRNLANEKPLLGRPLNDVLAWQRASAPSGCFCDAERRAHKWGLVLEVLHFALVQRELKAGNGHSAVNLQNA